MPESVTYAETASAEQQQLLESLKAVTTQIEGRLADLQRSVEEERTQDPAAVPLATIALAFDTRMLCSLVQTSSVAVSKAEYVANFAATANAADQDLYALLDVWGQLDTGDNSGQQLRSAVLADLKAYEKALKQSTHQSHAARWQKLASDLAATDLLYSSYAVSNHELPNNFREWLDSLIRISRIEPPEERVDPAKLAMAQVRSQMLAGAISLWYASHPAGHPAAMLDAFTAEWERIRNYAGDGIAESVTAATTRTERDNPSLPWRMLATRKQLEEIIRLNQCTYAQPL